MKIFGRLKQTVTNEHVNGHHNNYANCLAKALQKVQLPIDPFTQFVNIKDVNYSNIISTNKTACRPSHPRPAGWA